MLFIPVEDVCEVNIRQELAGEDMINTLYFHSGTGWDIGSMADLADRLDTALIAGYASRHNVQSTYLGLRLRNLTVEAGEVIITSTASPIVGTSGGGSMPNNAAFAIKFTTTLAGRSYRGRIYHGGISGSMLSGVNTVDTGIAADLVTFYEDLVDAAALAGGQHVVVSRYHDNAPRTAGIATPVLSITFTDRTLDSQRRRLPGRGT